MNAFSPTLSTEFNQLRVKILFITFLLLVNEHVVSIKIWLSCPCAEQHAYYLQGQVISHVFTEQRVTVVLMHFNTTGPYKSEGHKV